MAFSGGRKHLLNGPISALAIESLSTQGSYRKMT
jgi:hypothetical protein